MPGSARARRVLAAGVSVTIATIFASIGSLITDGPVAHAAGATSPRRVVVVIVDRTTAAMLQSVSAFQQMGAIGASGLIATTTGRGSDSPYAAAVSLSAGAPAIAPHQASPQWQSKPPPGPPPLGPLVVPGAAALRRANAASTVAAVPGLLGQTLRAHGVTTAAIGDADLPGRPNRPAAFLAMNEAGDVPLGAVAATDATGAAAPLPERTDLPALESEAKSALGTARFLVIDWGDTARVDALLQQPGHALSRVGSNGLTLQSRLLSTRAASLNRLGQFITYLQGILNNQRDVLVVLSPNPPEAQAGGALHLGPILVSGGRVATGTLTSPTTGILGVVSSSDLAPSILHWFGIAAPSVMRGHVLGSQTAGIGLPSAVANELRYERSARQRQIVLLALGVVWVAAVGIGMLVLELRGRRLTGPQPRGRGKSRGREVRGVEGVARWLVFSAAFSPLALLLQPLASNGSTALVLLEVVGACLLAGFLLGLMCRRRSLTGLGAIGILTLLAFLGDEATGGSLSVQTLAGPAFTRAGIGSSLDAACAGACLAAGLLAAGAMARGARATPWLRVFWIGVVGVVLLAISAPALGDAVALPVAGLLGLATLAIAGLRKPPGRRVWIEAGAVVAALILLLGIALVISDAAFAGRASAADRVPSHAAVAAVSLGGHAIATWGRFLFFTPWTVLLAIAVGAVIYVDRLLRAGPWTQGPRTRALPPADRHTQATVSGLLVTAGIALVLGVHGPPTATVVAMATALLVVATAGERTRPVPH